MFENENESKENLALCFVHILQKTNFLNGLLQSLRSSGNEGLAILLELTREIIEENLFVKLSGENPSRMTAGVLSEKLLEKLLNLQISCSCIKFKTDSNDSDKQEHVNHVETIYPKPQPLETLQDGRLDGWLTTPTPITTVNAPTQRSKEDETFSKSNPDTVSTIENIKTDVNKEVDTEQPSHISIEETQISKSARVANNSGVNIQPGQVTDETAEPVPTEVIRQNLDPTQTDGNRAIVPSFRGNLKPKQQDAAEEIEASESTEVKQSKTLQQIRTEEGVNQHATGKANVVPVIDVKNTKKFLEDVKTEEPVQFEAVKIEQVSSTGTRLSEPAAIMKVDELNEPLSTESEKVEPASVCENKKSETIPITDVLVSDKSDQILELVSIGDSEKSDPLPITGVQVSDKSDQILKPVSITDSEKSDPISITDVQVSYKSEQKVEPDLIDDCEKSDPLPIMDVQVSDISDQKLEPVSIGDGEKLDTISITDVQVSDISDQIIEPVSIGDCEKLGPISITDVQVSDKFDQIIEPVSIGDCKELDPIPITDVQVSDKSDKILEPASIGEREKSDPIPIAHVQVSDKSDQKVEPDLIDDCEKLDPLPVTGVQVSDKSNQKLEAVSIGDCKKSDLIPSTDVQQVSDKSELAVSTENDVPEQLSGKPIGRQNSLRLKKFFESEVDRVKPGAIKKLKKVAATENKTCIHTQKKQVNNAEPASVHEVKICDDRNGETKGNQNCETPNPIPSTEVKFPDVASTVEEAEQVPFTTVNDDTETDNRPIERRKSLRMKQFFEAAAQPVSRPPLIPRRPTSTIPVFKQSEPDSSPEIVAENNPTIPEFTEKVDVTIVLLVDPKAVIQSATNENKDNSATSKGEENFWNSEDATNSATREDEANSAANENKENSAANENKDDSANSENMDIAKDLSRDVHDFQRENNPTVPEPSEIIDITKALPSEVNNMNLSSEVQLFQEYDCKLKPDLAMYDKGLEELLVFSSDKFENNNPFQSLLLQCENVTTLQLSFRMQLPQRPIVALRTLPKSLKKLWISNAKVTYSNECSFELDVFSLKKCILDPLVATDFGVIFPSKKIEIESSHPEQHYPLLKQILGMDAVELVVFSEFNCDDEENNLNTTLRDAGILTPFERFAMRKIDGHWTGLPNVDEARDEVRKDCWIHS